MAVLKPGVVLATARGEAVVAEDSEVEAALLAELERELARAGSLTLFADLRLSERMPAKSRDHIAQWTRRHQAALRPSHVLVKSKLLEMAVSVLTMLIGGSIEVHVRPQPFLELLRRVAPQLTELPTVPAP
jgi:hypothetical protein